MAKIVIYPGRFEPFGVHHNEVYKSLVSKFGDVYITTSDVTNEKSPLNFEEKKTIIKKYGIDSNNIVKASKPYMPTELLDRFDKNSDSLIVVYGEKDYGRLSFLKKDGTPAYFKKYLGQKDLEPFKDSAYVFVAPHVSVNHNNNEICGSYLRHKLSTCTRQEMKELMGWIDENVYNLFRRKFKADDFYTKITESINNLAESYISLNQLQRVEQYADALFFRFGIDVDFKSLTRGSHFYQRLNDPRNNPPIEVDELRQLFKKVSEKYGHFLSKENTKASGVLKDMSSDINIPFVIEWNREKGLLDLRPKTIMRKRDFTTSDPIYKVENFREVFEANTTNQGKYTRHLNHPFESDMTLSEYKRFVFDVTQNTSVIQHCTLKLDGYNLQFTVKKGQVFCSRNKSTVLNPMSLEELRLKYQNNLNTQSVFLDCFKAFQQIISNIKLETLDNIFKNGSVFINLEVLDQRALNVFKFDKMALSVHSMITYDLNGTEVYRTDSIPTALREKLGIIFNGYLFMETPKVTLKPTLDNKHTQNLLRFQHKWRIPESTNISKLPDECLYEFKLMVFDLGNAVISRSLYNTNNEENINRIVGIIDSVSESLSNDSDLKTFNDTINALNSLGGYKSINPVEGIVLDWNGHLIKLTGSYGCLVPIFRIWNKNKFK